MNITKDNNITKVYFSPDIVENVIAVSDLQQSGHKIIFPAKTNDSGGAWIINDKTNKLIYKTSDNFLVDIHNINSTNSKLLQIKTVYSHLETNHTKIRDQVADLQRRFGYPSIHSMLELSKNIENFPVNEKQIKNDYVKFPWFDMGRMTRSTFNNSNKSRNIVNKIGDIVTTDSVNIKSYGSTYDVVHLYIDEHSKYMSVIFGKRSDAAENFTNNIKRIIQFYKKFNHTIKSIQTDSLQIYQTDQFLEQLNNKDINKRTSAPQEQQQNGKIERYVRTFVEQMTTIRHSAPWVPRKLIALQILLWVHIWNLQSGSLEISRKEEFEKIRPSAGYNDIPGAYGDAFLVHDARSIRTENFSHGRGPVMYVGPNFQTKDAHLFYDPVVNKVLTRRSFRRVASVPPAWLKMTEIMCAVGTEDNIVFDKFDGSDYNIWHQGALPTVVTDANRNACNLELEENVLPPNDGNSTFGDVIDGADVANLGTPSEHRDTQKPGIISLIASPVYSTPSGRLEKILQVNESPLAGTRHELLGGKNGNSALISQHSEDNEFEKFKISMVHMCHDLPQRNINEQSQYGLKFERNPTQQEIRNTILEIKKVWKIHGNKPALKNKKGTSRHTSPDIPKLSAALLSSDADQWIKAINAEYTQMGVENMYEAVATVPHGKPWVPSHMILVKQRYADGSIKKYKARLVAGGHRQDANSYNDISSPTARPATVKIIFAKAAIEKRILRTFDVKGAYLKSNIDEEIYMLLPIQKKGDKPQWVKLIKSIYGLKQAGKLWYENIKAKLLEFGAVQCPDDECLFRYTEGLEIIDIVIYVDDLLTASTTISVSVHPPNS